MSGGTSWPDEHIQELKRDYPSPKVSVDELSVRFGRSRDAVKSKANALGLKRPDWNGSGRPKGVRNKRIWVAPPPPRRPPPAPTPPLKCHRIRSGHRS